MRFVSAALAATMAVIFTACGFPAYSGFEKDAGGGGTGSGGAAPIDGGSDADAAPCTDQLCEQNGAFCDPTTHACVECLLPAHPCLTGNYCDATNVCRPGCGAPGDCSSQTCVAHVCTGVCSQGQAQCLGGLVQSCDPSGNWQSDATCSGPEHLMRHEQRRLRGQHRRRGQRSRERGRRDVQLRVSLSRDRLRE